MSKTYQLEICANSVLSALNAQEGGADRVELCQNLESGGTTPSLGQVWLARGGLSIGVHVLIRPRAGGFLYSDIEFLEMKADIMFCKEAKCDGVVIGMLLVDGQVDTVRMAELIELARPMHVTFHRAFDRCRDPFEALEVIIGLGCDRLLTSGMKDTAAEGAETIARLVEQANGRIEVMPGSGINEENILQIVASTGASSFHTSAKVEQESTMGDLGGEVGGMGDTTWVSAKEKIRQMADMLKSR
ncbi:copper homeostasis protein CutC [Parapedobacter sp. 10938]|uniref:copper homeostasis protein CutC n=1 Tax=Parapedobacter flavus TaxID=3110225 RepID=UPI002DBC084A|nr:copper homeostasis protein CutC [Parapedobacter sp. 10938]MEC3881040.1 copper homeostasis protein CutC [Parapedobacter sp. 10938]